MLARFDEALGECSTHAGSGIACIVTHHGMLRMVATRAGAEVTTIIPNLGGFWFDVVDGTIRNPEPVA